MEINHHQEELVVERMAALLAANAQLQQEINERKQIEATLRQREETLRLQNTYIAALHYTTLGLISRLDLDELLQTIIDQISRLLGAPHGFIWLIQPESGQMALTVGVGVFNRITPAQTKPGEETANIVWQTGQPLVINDYKTLQYLYNILTNYSGYDIVSSYTTLR